METYIDEKTGTKRCRAGETNPKWVVVGVTPRDDYTIIVDFIDGSKKSYDMKPTISKFDAFKKLQDINEFKKAFVDRDTVAWDEMLDIAPETLYDRGVVVANPNTAP